MHGVAHLTTPVGYEPATVPESRETSIRRGIEVLLALGSDESQQNGGLGVTRIADLVERDKSQVSRALSALAEYGLAERIPGERGYRLGWQVHVLATRTGQHRLIEQMTLQMRRLAVATGESAFAAVRRGDEIVVVVAEHPERSVLVRGTLGFSAPLLTSGAGRALMADDSRAEFDALFARAPAPRWTPKTLTDRDEIWARCERDRARGFFVSDEEYENELVTISAPIRRSDAGGPILAAVTIAGPRHRMIQSVEESGQEIIRVAQVVTASLDGGSTPP